jgi:NitT/TauT family transport system permease protein
MDQAQTYLLPTGVLILAVLAWELAVHTMDIPPYFLPAPSAIFEEMIAQRSVLLPNALVTLSEILGGFAASVLVGVPLAVAIAYSRFFERTLYPLLVTSQAVPKVAIAPLIIVWFGFGWQPKILVAFLIAFFPILIDTIVGVKSTPVEMIHLARSMGASFWHKFWIIRFPYALPFIFSGLKVAITLAVVASIVAEFVGADAGLGYVMQVANGQLNTRLLFAAMMLLSLMGVVLFFLVEQIERAVLPWHASKRVEEG